MQNATTFLRYGPKEVANCAQTTVETTSVATTVMTSTAIASQTSQNLKPTETSSSSTRGLSGGAIGGIVGGVVGGLAFIAVLGWLIVRYYRKSVRSNGETLVAGYSEENGYDRLPPTTGLKYPNEEREAIGGRVFS